jgi:hydrogenase maturation protease
VTDVAEAPIAVVGIGNVLMGDDGVGPTVVALLRAGWALPPSVALVDAGTPGLDLAGHLHGRDTVILVDTVDGGTPGDVRTYTGEELRRLPLAPRVSPHDPAVKEALWLAELGGRGPRRVLLVGVVPASTALGVGLSPAVARAAHEAVACVVAALAAAGVTAERSPAPIDAAAWWMRA